MTDQILMMYIILSAAVILFVTEIFRVDIVAMIIMLVLAWSGILNVSEAFSGFSGNAVISVIAIMMMGYGIEKSGIMNDVSRRIVGLADSNEKKLLVLICFSAGIVSSFMQNIGAVALFLPVVVSIAKRTEMPVSEMLMPLGFSTILGGTLTMIASGPLIILNDIVVDFGYDRFSFFSVAPVGTLLLSSGIIYMNTLGKKMLAGRQITKRKTAQDELREIYNISENIYEVTVGSGNLIEGKTIEELNIWKKYGLNILAFYEEGSIQIAPWRKTRFNSGQKLALLGVFEKVKKFTDEYNLKIEKNLRVFEDIKDEEFAGFAEIIVPPKSEFIGKSLSEIAVRKNFNIEPVIFISSEGNVIECCEKPLEAGQEIIVFGKWSDINNLRNIRDLILISSTNIEKNPGGKKEKIFAFFSLIISVVLVLSGFKISQGFMTGALIMIISGVIPKDEIYKGVDWKTVFLLAGLIPLGLAFKKTGAADMTAEFILGFLKGAHIILIITSVALMSSFFSLFMSNVAATVLLVPMIIIMSQQLGLNPRAMALLVAVSASNSFILPTHQVNAFLNSAGKYSSRDFLRTGSIMSIIFIFIEVVVFYIFYI